MACPPNRPPAVLLQSQALPSRPGLPSPPKPEEAVLFSALEELEVTASKAKVQGHCAQLGRLYQVGGGAEVLLLLPSLGAVPWHRADAQKGAMGSPWPSPAGLLLSPARPNHLSSAFSQGLSPEFPGA